MSAPRPGPGRMRAPLLVGYGAILEMVPAPTSASRVESALAEARILLSLESFSVGPT